ncbi:MAG: TerC family protein [Planctomycetota bacterium]
MIESLFNAELWIALITLTALEIVLGIDNLIFISILADRLPAELQARARRLGLLLAMGMRILLLLGLAWITHLTAPLFTVLSQEISGRDLVLIVGGLFLLAKATREMHHALEGEDEGKAVPRPRTMSAVLLQIVLLDIVFSLDSVITAIGMVSVVGVMVAAIVLAVAAMLLAAGAVSGFVARHPTVRMLALSFLLLIGVALVADGLDHAIPKGYLYFALGFSVLVEMLNLRIRPALGRPRTR